MGEDFLIKLAVASPVGACLLIMGGLADRFFRRVLKPMLLKAWNEYLVEWRADREAERQRTLAGSRLAVGVNRLAEALEGKNGSNGNGHDVIVKR